MIAHAAPPPAIVHQAHAVAGWLRRHGFAVDASVPISLDAVGGDAAFDIPANTIRLRPDFLAATRNEMSTRVQILATEYLHTIAGKQFLTLDQSSPALQRGLVLEAAAAATVALDLQRPLMTGLGLAWSPAQPMAAPFLRLVSYIRSLSTASCRCPVQSGGARLWRAKLIRASLPRRESMVARASR